MENKSKVLNFLDKHRSARYIEAQKAADQHLNRITLLQELLSLEEQKLTELVEKYGPDCLQV